MKAFTGHWRVLASLLVVLVLAVSCQAATATPTPAPTATPTRAAATPTPTAAAPTPTAAPTATPTRVVAAPTATPTVALKPTNTPVQAVNYPLLKPGTTPKSGGILRYWQPDGPGNWDPVDRGTSISLASTVGPVWERLIEFDKFSYSEPVNEALAQSWELASDSVTWTFHLKPGIVDHRGEPFTADDAVFMFKRAMNPPTGVTSRLKPLVAPFVKEVYAKDAQTVVFVTPKPDFEFLARVPGYYGAFIPSKSNYERFGNVNATPEQGVGTGPFKIKRWDNEVVMELERNPNYYQKGLPFLDGIQVVIGRDQASAFAAWRTGRIDITSRGGGMELNKEQVDIVKSMPNASIGLRMVGMSLAPTTNQKKTPWSDPMVRKAIDLALDREFICQAALSGLCSYGYYYQEGNALGFTAEEINKLPGYTVPKPKADLDEAKRLMAAAGYADGVKGVKFLAAKEYQAWSEAIMFELESKLGIRGTLTSVDSLERQKLENAGDYDIGWKPESAPEVTSTEHFRNVVCKGTSPTSPSFGFICDEKLDEMVLGLPFIFDPAEKKAASRKVLQYLYDQHYQRILFFPSRPLAWYNYVKNFSEPAGKQNYNETYRHVWIDKG